MEKFNFQVDQLMAECLRFTYVFNIASQNQEGGGHIFDLVLTNEPALVNSLMVLEHSSQDYHNVMKFIMASKGRYIKQLQSFYI